MGLLLSSPGIQVSLTLLSARSVSSRSLGRSGRPGSRGKRRYSELASDSQSLSLGVVLIPDRSLRELGLYCQQIKSQSTLEGQCRDHSLPSRRQGRTKNPTDCGTRREGASGGAEGAGAASSCFFSSFRTCTLGKAVAPIRETSGRYGASHFSGLLFVSLAARTLRTRAQESAAVLSRADR